MFGGIPFEHFAHGGMGGGMPSSMGGRGREDVDTTKLYETLEVEKDCDQKEIKKAYRKLSRTHHPDKGGDEHKFKEINAAYEILSDPEKRAAYDKYGLEGVSEEGGMQGAGGEDLFSMFFGGSGRRGRQAGPRKGPSVKHPLKVSLEDLYNGKTVKLAIHRKVLQGEPKTCEKCKGQGAVMEIRQIGPGIIQQMQRSCSNCQGQGYECETTQQRQVLEVHIDKGMKNEQKITFRNMADEAPNVEAGDIHFIIQEKPHELFKRKNADLLVTKEVSLHQALCGFSWKIKQLDGRWLRIKTRPGEVIKPEMNTEEALPFIKTVANEGMPSLGNPFVNGNLYILFRVKFPNDGELAPETIEALKTLLPQDGDSEEMDRDDEDEDVEEVHMDHADVRHFGKGGAAEQGNGAYDSDDDEDGRGGVQCQQS